MGITQNFLKSHLFFADVGNNPEKELGEECMADPELVFEGYRGRHYYKNYGCAEIIANTDNERVTGLSIGIQGDKFCFLRIIDDLGGQAGDLEHLVFCEPMDGKSKEPFPVCLVNADVLPCFSPGTTIFGQAVCYAAYIKAAASPEDLFNDLSADDLEKAKATEGEIFAERHNEIIQSPTVWGKVRRKGIGKVTRMLKNPDGGELTHPGLPFFELETSIGIMPFYMLPSEVFMDDGLREMINAENCYVSCSFVIALDVAVGEYQEGAIFDELHLLRVLGEALKYGKFERIEKSLSDDVTVVSNATAWNKKDAMMMLTSFYGSNPIHNSKLKIDLIRIKDVKGKDSVLKKGQYGLSLTGYADRGLKEFAFISLDKNGRITSIIFCYGNDSFEYNTISIDDVMSFGIRAGELPYSQNKIGSELYALLNKLIIGGSDDWTELYANLADDSEFDNAGYIHKGRANAYYFMHETVMALMGRKREIFSVEPGIAVIEEDGFGHIFTMHISDDGKIKTIRRSSIYAKSKSEAEE